MKSRSFLLLPLAVCLLLFAIMVTAVAQTSTPAGNFSGPPSQPSLEAAYGRLPLSFEPNRGQTDPRVRFLSRGNGYSLFLTDSSAVLALSKDEHSSSNRLNPSGLNQKTPLPGARSFKTDVIRMELAGARPNLRVTGAEQLQGTANYFIGQDPAKWRSSLPTFAKVKYEDVHPGIDLVYYGNQRQLEYDFILAPHADPQPLRLHFAGALRLKLTPGGDLAIVAKNGEIAFHKPVVYQLKNGLREPVEGRFQLVASNSVGFLLGRYDHSRTLVIDPALAYSTYLGGSGPCVNSAIVPAATCESGNAIAVDAAGDAYVVGGSINSDFPVTAGAFQKINNGMAFDNGFYLNNAFITKFSPRGSVIYSTYLGGTTDDEYLGIFNGDVATGVAIDAAENAYVTGYASSYNFPVTSNAYQKVNNANFGTGGGVSSNAFVTKLNPTGSALLYSTYLGGGGNGLGGEDYIYGDYAVGIAIDSAGDAYVAGSTISGDFPVTTDAFQKVNNAANNSGFNLFVTKFNPAGSALVYSTYLGGSALYDHEAASDTAGGIAIDSAGDAYVTGTAYSRDFPVTANAYQKVNNSLHDAQNDGGSNAIISELNPTGSVLVYSTYLGGSANAGGGYASDGGSSIAVNSEGNAYVAGGANSCDFPTTSGAFQPSNGVCGGPFVTELNPTGSALVYSTYLRGGNGGSSINSIALDAFGSAYVTGATYSTNFPVTPDAFRKANHSPGGGNAFVSKLDPTGSTLLYSSYIGGSANQGGGFYGDAGNGIAVDWFGDAYITGQTCSNDFPLASVPFQAKNKGTGCTAFVSKFIVNTVTGTRLVSNSNPGKVGPTATFTASVTPNEGTTIPTGSVVFSLDGTPQVTVPLDGSGQATYSNSSLAAGRYTVTATYLGNPTTSGSVGNLGQLIIGDPARITVASGTYQTGVEGSPYAKPLVVLVQDERGIPVPGAVVDFRGPGLTFSGNPAMTAADGMALVVATPTAVGSLTAMANVAGVATPATFKLTATQP